ncbi:MAG: minor capsid protein [Eubacteriales bacterium]|nr:minor capsid protein [Eubacteriales bacterium]
MKMTVESNLDGVAAMLKKRGLEVGGRVQRLFTNEVARYADPYIPMQQGALKNMPIIEDDGIIYNTPYARYQYYGKVMVGKAPKKLTERSLTYHGAPKRGAFWDKRMWADKKSIIMDMVAKEAGGRAE